MTPSSQRLVRQIGIRRPRRTALTGVILIVLATALGIWVSVEGARKTGELRFDQTLAAHRDSWMTGIAWFCNALFGPPLALGFLIFICLVVAWRNTSAAVMIGGMVALCWTCNTIAKLVFARHRPPTVEAHALIRKTGLNSFPSGHTAFAASLLAGTVLALRLCGRTTRTAWLVGIPGVLLVAFTRLYLGAHYLGDVIGAMLYASGVVLIGVGMLGVWITQ